MTSDAFKDRARRDPAVKQSTIRTEVKVFRRSWSRVGSLRLLHGTLGKLDVLGRTQWSPFCPCVAGWYWGQRAPALRNAELIQARESQAVSGTCILCEPEEIGSSHEKINRRSFLPHGMVTG